MTALSVRPIKVEGIYEVRVFLYNEKYSKATDIREIFVGRRGKQNFTLMDQNNRVSIQSYVFWFTVGLLRIEASLPYANNEGLSSPVGGYRDNIIHVWGAVLKL